MSNKMQLYTVYSICKPLKTLYTPSPHPYAPHDQRIISSPEQASRMWVFLNKFFLQEGVVSTSPNPQAEGPPFFGCPRLLIQFMIVEINITKRLDYVVRSYNTGQIKPFQLSYAISYANPVWWKCINDYTLGWVS